MHLISPHLTSSHLISSHLISSCPISSRLISVLILPRNMNLVFVLPVQHQSLILSSHIVYLDKKYQKKPPHPSNSLYISICIANFPDNQNYGFNQEFSPSPNASTKRAFTARGSITPLLLLLTHSTGSRSIVNNLSHPCSSSFLTTDPFSLLLLLIPYLSVVTKASLVSLASRCRGAKLSTARGWSREYIMSEDGSM